MIHLGRVQHTREFGVYRLIVYGSAILIMIFLIFAAFNLKKVIRYKLNSSYCN